MVLNILKYIVFAGIALILITLWNGVFILQSAIGYQNNIFLLPFKLLPIFLYSSVAFWLILKMFDNKKKVKSRKKLSLLIGGLAIIMSLSFQYFNVSKAFVPFAFKNKMFSHLEVITLNSNFNDRMALSSAQYIKLIPFSPLDKNLTSFISNVVKESTLVFKLKKAFDKKNINDTCKQYIKMHTHFGHCIIDFQKEIYSHYTLTSTGDVLLLAVMALAIFTEKELMSKEYGNENVFFLTKLANDIIEISIHSIEKSKLTLMKGQGEVVFSMGHKMSSDSIFSTIERQVKYKYFINAVDKAGHLALAMEEKKQTRKVSSIKFNNIIGKEQGRTKKFKNRLMAFQKNGFTVEEMKLKLEKVDREMEMKLKQLQEKSVLLKLITYFDPSLNGMIKLK